MPFSVNPPLKRVKTRLRKLSYQSFRRHEQVRGWLHRHVLPRGYGVAATCVVSAVMCLGNPSATLLQGLALLSVVLLIGVIHVWNRRSPFDLQRSAAHQVVAGQCWVQRFEVRARRATGAYRLLLLPPDARPTFAEFAQAREPQEHRRNAFDRIMAFHRWQWLVQQRQCFSPQHSPWQQQLAEGETQVIELSVRPLRRGVLSLESVHIQLPDVFFLWQRCRRFHLKPLSLLVLPRRYPLSFSCFGNDASGRRESTQLPSTPNSHGELRGLRPYQMGDSPRQIHWRATARTGKFISKEFEEPQNDRLGLVLDTFSTATAEVFEAAVSVCASLLHAAQQQQRPLAGLRFSHEPFTTMTRQKNHPNQCQRRLAEVQAQPLPDHAENHSAHWPRCILVTTHWPPLASQLNRCAMDHHSRVLCISNSAPLAMPRHARLIRPDHLAHDLLNLRL